MGQVFLIDSEAHPATFQGHESCPSGMVSVYACDSGTGITSSHGFTQPIRSILASVPRAPQCFATAMNVVSLESAYPIASTDFPCVRASPPSLQGPAFGLSDTTNSAGMSRKDVLHQVHPRVGPLSQGRFKEAQECRNLSRSRVSGFMASQPSKFIPRCRGFCSNAQLVWAASAWAFWTSRHRPPPGTRGGGGQN